MYKILIAENIPSLNKGEMTILDGMLESFRTLGEAQVSVLSDRPEIDAPRYVSKAKVIDIRQAWPLNGGSVSGRTGKILASILVMLQHLSFVLLYKLVGAAALRLFKSEIWEEYAKADVILMGHNGAFGTGGGIAVPVYFYPLYLPFFANAMGKPVVFYGGSTHEYRRFRCLLSRVFKSALGRMDLIALRERVSYQMMRSLGLQSDKMFVTADPAFLLQPVSHPRAIEIMEHESIAKEARPLIGITVTRRRASMAFPQLKNPEHSCMKHAEVFAEVIDNLIARLAATVVFIPHCIGFGEELDDRIVAADIRRRCQNKDRVKVVTTEYAAAEVKGLIGQFGLLIGERVHSVINAMSMGVPSVVICHSSDQRLDIIRMLGQDEAIYFVEDLAAGALLSKICDIWAKKEGISAELECQTEIMRERAMLNGKLLKDLLESRKKG